MGVVIGCDQLVSNLCSPQTQLNSTKKLLILGLYSFCTWSNYAVIEKNSFDLQVTVLPNWRNAYAHSLYLTLWHLVHQNGWQYLHLPTTSDRIVSTIVAERGRRKWYKLTQWGKGVPLLGSHTFMCMCQNFKPLSTLFLQQYTIHYCNNHKRE